MTAQPLEPDASGIIELPVTEARARLTELLDLVETEDQFVYLTRHGKRVAALMPADIAENYETIEDDYWARRAAEVDTSDTIPWEQVVAGVEGRR
jgi:prevent-host-death family protein